MKQILPMITLCLMAISMSAVAESTATSQGYVDLGLPSGTLWKTERDVGLYTYAEAVSKFGKQLPTSEQI